MNRRIGGFVLLSGVLFAGGCSRGDSFTLEGTLENGAGCSLYVEELTPDGAVFLDSVRLDEKGRFVFRHDLEYETFFNLHSNEQDYVVLLPRAGERLTLNGDYQSLQWSYRVSGSEGSTLLWQLQDYSNHGIEVLTELVQQDQENRQRWGAESAAYKAAKEKTDSVYREAAMEQVEYVSRFIQEHRGSLATLIALYKQFNRHDIIAPEVNFDYYELVLEGLEEEMPDNPHTVHFKNRVENLRHRYGKPREAIDMVFDGE
ncbi:MAG: peroxiredoxin [bacterium P3]|nr:MAG: peroxiredoxin [bacterium P3]KWW42754.1 MAG: peroxiredoxin [bacterium F083]